MSFKKEQKKERSQQGFTLIELAIVLIIIGLIIGAVLKGQDLIQNARIKSFINYVRGVEISQWGYYDRNGDFANATVADEPNTLADMSDFSDRKQIGSNTFYTYPVQYTPTGSSRTYRGLVFTPDLADDVLSGTPDDNDLLIVEFYKSLDTAIDGSADGSTGSVRAWAQTETAEADGGITITSLTAPANGWNTSGTVGSASGVIYWFDLAP